MRVSIQKFGQRFWFKTHLESDANIGWPLAGLNEPLQRGDADVEIARRLAFRLQIRLVILHYRTNIACEITGVSSFKCAGELLENRWSFGKSAGVVQYGSFM